jgi:hypothetical protein
MTEQLTLELSARDADLERARADAEELVALLDGNPALRRRPAAQLCEQLGWNDRRLRAAAEASDGEVLSAPGCTGYRLARHTPVSDYLATEYARYTSQISEMQRRVCLMTSRVHARANRGA